MTTAPRATVVARQGHMDGKAQRALAQKLLNTGNSMTLRVSRKRRRLREKGILAYGTSNQTEWRGNRRVGDFMRDGFSAGQRVRAAQAFFALLVLCRFEFRSRRPLSQLKKGSRD